MSLCFNNGVHHVDAIFISNFIALSTAALRVATDLNVEALDALILNGPMSYFLSGRAQHLLTKPGISSGIFGGKAMNEVTKLQVAVHSVYKRAKSGFLTRWLESAVVVGKQPCGPRGGVSGTWVDGRIECRFKTREEALDYVDKLRREGKVL